MPQELGAGVPISSTKLRPLSNKTPWRHGPCSSDAGTYKPKRHPKCRNDEVLWNHHLAPTASIEYLFSSLISVTMRVSTTAVSAGLLALLGPVTAAPLTTDLDKESAGLSNSPPTPVLFEIPGAELPGLAAKFMPPFIDGEAKVPSFKPSNLEIIREPVLRPSMNEKLGQPDDSRWMDRFPKTTKDDMVSIDDKFRPKWGLPDTIIKDKGFDRDFTRVAPTRLSPRDGLPVLDDATRLGFPYSAVGKVFLRDGQGNVIGTCSGAAIGPGLVLTANHCFPRGVVNGSMQFVPAFDAKNPVSEPYGSAHAVKCRGVKEPLLDGTDYLVCLLNKKIGPTSGWLGWQAWDNDAAYLNGVWSSVGYPWSVDEGRVPCYKAAVRITKVENSGVEGKLLSGPAYVSQGWSGGPLFGWVDKTPYIAGVVVAAAGTSVRNEVFTDTAFHAAGKRLAELIQWSTANLTASTADS